MNKMLTGLDRPRLIYIGDSPDFFANGVTISFSLNHKILSPNFEIVQIEEQLLPKHSVTFKVWRTLKCLRRLQLMVKKKKFSIFYTNLPLTTFGVIKALLYLWVARQSNCKAVLHLHRGDFFSSFYKKRTHKALARRIFFRSDLVILLSQRLRKKMCREFEQTQFAVVPNRIEEEYVFTKEANSNYTFLFVSNYFESKGIFDLLKVFTELSVQYPMIRLECYGMKPNRKIKERLSQYESESIQINDSIHGRSKFEKMSESSCVVLPSWNEGQPVVLLEAMSLGVPVIATDVGYVNELLGSDYPYLCEAQNQSDLKSRLIGFIDDPDKAQIGEKLKKRYYQWYSISKHQKQLTALFENLTK